MNSSRIVRFAHSIHLNETALLNGAYHYLNSLNVFGIRLELDRINTICRLLNNPQNCYPSIIVGGTNGKGSVCAFLASILNQAGLKVGLFTSPHLVNATERIQINRIPIDSFRLARLIYEHRKLDRQNGINLTYFECMTSIAFQYFKEEKIDFGVFEVGMGGTYDATNILKPLFSCVTHIHYDHTNYLGLTLSSIAKEKAGIIKNNGCFIHLERRAKLKKIFKTICAEKNSLCINALEGAKVSIEYDYPFCVASYSTPHHKYQPVAIPLLGEHQVYNALLALRIAEELVDFGFSISPAAIETGIEQTRWNGRLEIVKKNPFVIVDSAHNLEGMQIAFEALHSLKKRRLIVVFGVLRDKLWQKMLKIVDFYSDYLILTEPLSERALSAMEFSQLNIKTSYEIVPDPLQAYAKAIDQTERDSIVLVIGSTYLAGQLRHHLIDKKMHKH